VRSVGGPANGSQFGKACIVVPDQNGDGYRDLLVGATGFNQASGAVYCVSGAYLALGTGAQTLWSLTPLAAGSSFGAAIVDVGNVTGNSATDFVVGAPGYRFNPSSGITNGALVLVDGSTHAVAATIYGPNNTALGEQLVSVGDQNGDGKTEFATTVRALNLTSPSAVYVMHGAAFSGTMSVISTAHSVIDPGANEFGDALASGFDLDGDGLRDLAIGSPRMLGGNGQMRVVSADDAFTSIAAYSGTAGEHMGASLDASADYDGDGVVDIVVGAPNALGALGGEAGRVVVLSGGRLASNTPPFEIRSLTHPSAGTGGDPHFGAAVRACDDLNGDGIGDILVGAPDLLGTAGLQTVVKGNLSVFSGATFTRWTGINGGIFDHFGRAIAGTVGDLDGDGFKEFVASGTNGFATGYVACYRLFPVPPGTYCTGKQNSLGCTPLMSFSGSPHASSGTPFVATANNVINQKLGICFYGHAPAAEFFQGGFMCVASPTRRTPVQSSGGSLSGNDCTGTFSFDFNVLIASGIDPALVAGAEVFAQYWSRDTASPSTTSLSNALRFVINP
jgi:hypothetical protein